MTQTPLQHRVRPWASAICSTLGLATLAAAPLLAQAGTTVESDLSSLDIEELMSVEVSSVSRRAEPLLDSAAAVYVITGEELRRLGIRNLGEALRLAPGLDVAALNAQDYAVNARGLSNGSSSNKLEVLIDGRSIYTPLFSGVLWDQQVALIEDIERIEVIRGPAGTLWGANAVNGVINIVSKAARKTAGALVLGGTGTETQGYAAVRYGFDLGPATQARVHVLGYRRKPSATPAGQDSRDGYQPLQGGFRGDSNLGAAGLLTVQGDAYRATAQDGPVDTALSGWNLVSTWHSPGDEHGQWVLHGYLDHYRRDTPAVFGERRDTQHLEIQRRWIASEHHDLIVGLNYRRSADQTEPNRSFTLDPADRVLQTYGLLLQDDISLLPERWRLTLGTRLERNDYTGIEWQPSIRTAYTPNDRSTLWAAASRAVRTPTRLDHDGVSTVSGAGAAGVIADPGGTTPPEDPTGTGNSGTIRSIFGALFGDGGSTAQQQRFGNPEVRSEQVLAYELGYRMQLSRNWVVDAAAFYNDYDRLQSVESDGVVGNSLKGRTQGVELLTRYRFSDRLQAHLDWTHLVSQLRPRPGSTDTTTVANTGNDPHNYGGLRLSYAPSPGSHIDTYLRHVGARPNLGIPAYENINLAWSLEARPGCWLRVLGTNLLDAQQPEGSDTEIQRAVELQLELSL